MELKKSHPNINLIFICYEKYARLLDSKLKEVFDKIFYINPNQILISKDTISLNEVKNNLKNILKNINSIGIDVAINLSYTKTSSYFTSLIESSHKLGFVHDKNNKTNIADSWSQFVFSNNMSGPYGCFSLVDTFKGILGTKHNSFPQQRSISKNKKIIFTPFSSHKKTRWPLGKWAEVIYQTLKNYPDISIVIMSSIQKKKYANELLKNPIFDKFKKRLSYLAMNESMKKTKRELKESKLFVGHNSTEAHLASLFDIQTLTISLGTSQLQPSLPYGHSNYNLSSRINCYPCFAERKCDTFPCHPDISHNIVSASIDDLLKYQEISPQNIKVKIPEHFIDKVDIHRTHIDPGFGMFFENILHNKNTTINIFKNFYRVLWGFILNDNQIQIPFDELSFKQYHVLQNYYATLNYVVELNKFGKTYSRYIIEEAEQEIPSIVNIKRYSNKIIEINQFFIKLKEIHPHLAPLIDFYHLANINAPGDSIKEISESSFLIYHEALGASEALQELISSTIDNSQHSVLSSPPQQTQAP